MYPFGRMLKEHLISARKPVLGFFDTHVSHHICWPWDLDPWVELNNGRTLTFFDLGRVALAARIGLAEAIRKNGWGMTVAGNSLRYRRRVRMLDRLEMRSRCIGWDARFVYMEQSMWKDGECTSHMLLRSAVTSAKGIVAPARVMEALDQPPESPALPDWVQGWIDSDASRPWPPLLP